MSSGTILSQEIIASINTLTTENKGIQAKVMEKMCDPIVDRLGYKILSPLTGTISANTTYTIAEGEAVYTCIIPKAYLVASSGGPFTLTLTTGVSGKETVMVTILAAGLTAQSTLEFSVYVDSAGNVSSDYRYFYPTTSGQRRFTKEYTGTLGSADGGYTGFLHGITPSKIRSISCIVRAPTGNVIMPAGQINSAYTGSYQYVCYETAGTFVIAFVTGQSSNIYGGTYYVTIEYVE